MRNMHHWLRGMDAPGWVQ